MSTDKYFGWKTKGCEQSTVKRMITFNAKKWFPPERLKNARNKTFSPQGSLDLHDIKVCPQALSENARNKIFAPSVLLKMKFCSPQDSLLLSELLTPCQTDSPQLCPRFFLGQQTPPRLSITDIYATHQTWYLLKTLHIHGFWRKNSKWK